jgi:DNA-binding MarR family transcriptional regulator
VTNNPWHWIIDEPYFSSQEKLVALVIKRHANASGWAWPSPERIARLSGLSRATVFRAIGSLEKKNILEKDGHRYRIVQRQGLLFSSSNSLWESCENREDILLNPVGESLPQRLDSLPVRREVRTSLEDRKSKPPRAQPARAPQVWKLREKAKRLLREIDLIRETNAGTLGGFSDRTNEKITTRLIELERIGFDIRTLPFVQIEKAG